MSDLLDVSQGQIIRGRILSICGDAQPLGAGMEVITAVLKKECFDINKQKVQEACFYLEGKGLLKIDCVKNDVLNISRQIANITPLGIDILDGVKMVDGVLT